MITKFSDRKQELLLIKDGDIGSSNKRHRLTSSSNLFSYSLCVFLLIDTTSTPTNGFASLWRGVLV